MASNHFEGKILNVRPNLAVKINPVFYQLLNGSYEGWFYERFINLISYEKQGQHIVAFVDNNSNVYESRVKTIHVYGIDELGSADIILDREKGRDYVHKGAKGKGTCNV